MDPSARTLSDADLEALVGKLTRDPEFQATIRSQVQQVLHGEGVLRAADVPYLAAQLRAVVMAAAPQVTTPAPAAETPPESPTETPAG